MENDSVSRRYTVGKVLAIIFGVLFVMGLIGSLFGEDTSTSSGGSSNTEKPVVATTAAPKTPEQQLQDRVEKEAGDESNIDGYKNRVRTVTISEGTVTIAMNGQENLTSGTTKSSNRRLVLDAIKALQGSGVDYETAKISVYFPLVDNLGNTSMDEVLRYIFTADRINKINTENIDTKRMDSDFADVGTVVHPAFRW